MKVLWLAIFIELGILTSGLSSTISWKKGLCLLYIQKEKRSGNNQVVLKNFITMESLNIKSYSDGIFLQRLHPRLINVVKPGLEYVDFIRIYTNDSISYCIEDELNSYKSLLRKLTEEITCGNILDCYNCTSIEYCYWCKSPKCEVPACRKSETGKYILSEYFYL